ncbi:MAG: DUF362 domain-containing protein [Deltaproteobacteria bacterium]|nr:DUF362 domain-containing protein [Deltaproteobacteria bacterium]
MPKVYIIDATYENVKERIRAALCNYLQKISSKSVLLKPNLLSGEPPEKAVCTHPLFIKAVVDILEEEGFTVKVSDNPGVSGYGSSVKAARESGILNLIGDRFENPSESAERVSVNSGYTDSFVVSGNILHAGCVINLPKFKTHSLTLFSGAIKNMFGILVGGEKARAHSLGRTREEFAEILVDIYNIRVPEITVMDAIWGMEGSGPSNGKRRIINKVLISDDGFAVDAVCARMMGLEPYEIPYLKVASDRGLLDAESIQIDGNPEVLRNFNLPPTYNKMNFAGGAFIGFVNSFVFEHFIKGPARLSLIRKKCTKCYVCIRQCPANAMEKGKDDYPKINKKICIDCYCCDELCPEGAWRQTGIMRFIGR